MTQFATRVDWCARAIKLNPDVRREERQIALDLLDIRPGHVVLDTPAWYGYFADGVPAIAKQILCVEPSRGFLKLVNPKFTRICANGDSLAVESDTVDRAASLVGLHHHKDKLAIVREMTRTLKPGGRVCVSEVVNGTSVATFLNVEVNRLSPRGHAGIFVEPAQLTRLLVEAGCTAISERFYDLYWRFRSITEMGEYCWYLLGLSRATMTDTLDAIERRLRVEVAADGSVALHWPLAYAVGTKANATQR